MRRIYNADKNGKRQGLGLGLGLKENLNTKGTRVSQRAQGTRNNELIMCNQLIYNSSGMVEYSDGYIEPKMQTCEACEGEGTFAESNCCGATIIYTDICSDCGEHCEISICEICKGNGEIEV